jgi:hypothetical protein
VAVEPHQAQNHEGPGHAVPKDLAFILIEALIKAETIRFLYTPKTAVRGFEERHARVGLPRRFYLSKPSRNFVA